MNVILVLGQTTNKKQREWIQSVYASIHNWIVLVGNLYYLPSQSFAPLTNNFSQKKKNSHHSANINRFGHSRMGIPKIFFLFLYNKCGIQWFEHPTSKEIVYVNYCWVGFTLFHTLIFHKHLFVLSTFKSVNREQSFIILNFSLVKTLEILRTWALAKFQECSIFW